MGQNTHKPCQLGISGHWHHFKRGNLHHCFTKAQLLQLEAQSQEICITYAPLLSKSTQQIMDLYQYYHTRSTLTSHPQLISLLKFQLIDQKGSDITAEIQKNTISVNRSSKDKVNVNTLCNLNIFEGYCKRSNLQEKSRFDGQIRFIQEYISNNLQFESEKRREKGQPYSQKQIYDILITGVQAALILLNSQLKQPLLSPLGIKITTKGKIKIGQWQCTHLYEDKHEHEEETNFIEEGEMYLHPEINSKQPIVEKQTGQFNVLTHFYWPPQGTTAIQNTTNLGIQTSRNTSKAQIFSLGMTALHLLLERPLYQKQTYSEKIINRYIQETINYRETSKQPLSEAIISILKKMLAWDPKERISYFQLQAELVEMREKYSQRSRSIWSSSAQVQRSVRVPIAKSVIVRDVDGSGSVDQGYGDEVHPEAEIAERPSNTLRLKTQESSLDYQKIDYTIRRERKEWEMFQNRLSTSSSYQTEPPQHSFSQPTYNKQLFQQQQATSMLYKSSNSFPAEIMLEQDQDSPNEQQLCFIIPDNRRQIQVTDEEQQSITTQQNNSGVTESIKLLDISNIKVKNSNQKISNKTKLNPQSTHKLFANFLENEESFSNMLHGKNINVQAFMNESDSLLLKSSVSPKLQKQHQNPKTNEQLFTSPQLMALIRSSAYRPRDNEASSYRNAKLQLSPEPILPKPKCNNQLSFSTYVKQQFAKGWYQGGKSEGLRNGYGTFHYNQGGKYCGDWLNSQMHGQGTLYYADGRIAYQGQWRFDSLNGEGILYNENPKRIEGKFDYRNFNLSEDVWVYYQGSFINDDKNGKGILLLSNGERFEGGFQDDLIQGLGTFYSVDGEIIKGQWRANRLTKILSIDQNETLIRSPVIETKH